MDHGRLRWAISKTSGICAFLFARQQWKVLRHNPLKSFFFSNHQRWQSFTLVILIGPSWDVNLSRDPFLVECTAAFSASSLTSFIRFPPSCHFLEPSMSTSQFLFIILEPSKSRSSPSRAWSTSDVGTTQCSRDSTKMDFLTASSDISTLLATSSSSAASIGDQDMCKHFFREQNTLFWKQITLSSEKVKSQEIPSLSCCDERKYKQGLQLKSTSEAQGSVQRWKWHWQEASSKCLFNARFFGHSGGKQQEMTGHSESVIEVLHWWNSALSYSRSATELKVVELKFTESYSSFFSPVWWEWSAFLIPWISVTKTVRQKHVNNM